MLSGDGQVEKFVEQRPPLSQKRNSEEFSSPFDTNAEAALLGALLQSTDSNRVDELTVSLNAEDFYAQAHARIFESILSLVPIVPQIDLVTVADHLRKRKLLNEIGGMSFLTSLTHKVIGGANLFEYVGILNRLRLRRQLLKMVDEIQRRVNDYSKSPQEILEFSERRILEIVDGTSDKRDFSPARAVVEKATEIIHQHYKHKNSLSGVPSGFSELDSYTLGFHKAEMIILGARPSVGKTAFALSIASYLALNHVPCGFFTLEMNDIALMNRILSAEAQVDSRLLRSGLLSNDHWARIHRANEELYEVPLYIDDTPNIRLMELRSRARRMVRKHGVRIIFIDYIGLITIDDKALPRHEQMAEISMNLKSLARELNIPIFALSQLGRQSEGRSPGLADLRGSGALEQDADTILYLYRERLNEEMDSPQELIETELQVAKQRNGPVGNIKLYFKPSLTKFLNMERQQHSQ